MNSYKLPLVWPSCRTISWRLSLIIRASKWNNCWRKTIKWLSRLILLKEILTYISKSRNNWLWGLIRVKRQFRSLKKKLNSCKRKRKKSWRARICIRLISCLKVTVKKMKLCREKTLFCLLRRSLKTSRTGYLFLKTNTKCSRMTAWRFRKSFPNLKRNTRELLFLSLSSLKICWPREQTFSTMKQMRSTLTTKRSMILHLKKSPRRIRLSWFLLYLNSFSLIWVLRTWQYQLAKLSNRTNNITLECLTRSFPTFSVMLVYKLHTKAMSTLVVRNSIPISIAWTCSDKFKT